MRIKVTEIPNRLNKEPLFSWVRIKQLFCNHKYEVAIVTGQRSHIFPDPLNTMDTTEIVVFCSKCSRKFYNSMINYKP